MTSNVLIALILMPPADMAAALACAASMTWMVLAADTMQRPD